jgi:meiosis-specific APC/C activator protein AMA1
MEYTVTLTDRINLEDSDSTSRSSVCLDGKPRVRNPNVSESPDWRVSPKSYSKTVKFRGRYDGPDDAPPDHPEPETGASGLPSRHPRTLTCNRPSLKAFHSNSSKSTRSLRSPDRFLPRRPILDSAVQSFRVNKDPESLSNSEKLLRNNEASPDAFNPRRRVTSPVLASNGLPVLPVRRNLTPTRGGGASALTFHRDPVPANGERHVSVGTVWTVGGLAPVNAGVPNGRGRLLGTGTNAPLYTTPFSTARPKAEEELEEHEGRLAEALQLDRVTRVLEFRERSTSPQKSPKIIKENALKETKTIWKGTEWVMGGRDPKSSTTQEVCFAVLNLTSTNTDSEVPGSNPAYCSFQSPRRSEPS